MEKPHFLERIHDQAISQPGKAAIISGSERLGFAELWERSDALAAYILASEAAPKAPIAVYGHKSPLMLVCFLACAKSGHAYVPQDVSIPLPRVRSTLDQLGSGLVLATEPLEYDGVLSREDIEQAIADNLGAAVGEEHWVCGEDVFYMIFTSGSTGAPKGIMVTESCVSNFFPWALGIGGHDKSGKVLLNQAPFSFDLSVYELAMALAGGGTLFCLPSDVQHDMRRLFDVLGHCDAEVWISTPSFAAMCLADKGFSKELLPRVGQFIFCGETLLPTTAAQLLERFPGAQVINTYGPTESTVAVSEVDITAELAQSGEPLPVGYARPGTVLHIVDELGHDVAPGTHGEILIEGDTVSRGYFGRGDLTEAAFSVLPDGTRTFRTGDEGYLDDDGCLHFIGRLDFQIKLHGYRIELGDIENNIDSLPYVSGVAAVPMRHDGAIVGIAAFVCLSESVADSDFAAGQKIRKDLATTLPQYMIPRKVVIKDALPRTGNGKVDRKKLEQELH